MLFIGHEASRTGAPIMLLHLLRWLRENTDIDFDLLLLRDGPLVNDYEHVCKVFIADRHIAASAPHVAIKRTFRLGSLWQHWFLLTKLKRRNIGLVYLNTITNIGILKWLSQLERPVICHAHEVESHFFSTKKTHLEPVTRHVSRLIAVTEQMEQSLIVNGVPRDRITVVPAFLPVVAPNKDTAARRTFRERHSIPEDVVLVGGCGRVHWQKGPDLLLHVARMLARRPNSHKLHFVWLGGQSAETGFEQLRWDIKASNLTGKFLLIPNSSDILEYMRSIDIFALPSRNDPSPMVALEAGAQGAPVVCFSGNSGMVDDQSGRVVPYLDLDGFANAIEELANDDRLRVTLGKRLTNKVIERHDANVVMPAIVEIIRSFLDRQNAAMNQQSY